MKYIFGPVLSRRLGLSLGIDIIPFKTCSFNCTYCECGRTTIQTSKRKPFIKAEKILKELKSYLKENSNLDYLTITGSGEPTLNTELKKIILEIKKISDIPVAVLTNGSLMHIKQVRKELSYADLIVPSLDAVSTELFTTIDKPLKTFNLKKYIQGLKEFRKEFKGQIWLEIFLIKNLNDAPDEIEKLIKTSKMIKPDKIQLNTLDRPPVDNSIQPISHAKLKSIAELFINNKLNVEVASLKKKKRKKSIKFNNDIEKMIIDLVSRRPETIPHIAEVFQLSNNKIKQVLKTLIKKKYN